MQREPSFDLRPSTHGLGQERPYNLVAENGRSGDGTFGPFRICAQHHRAVKPWPATTGPGFDGHAFHL